MAVDLSLEEDEALVLFELLASGNLKEGIAAAERNALLALEAALEKILTAPFSPDYSKKLEIARQTLLVRYGA